MQERNVFRVLDGDGRLESLQFHIPFQPLALRCLILGAGVGISVVGFLSFRRLVLDGGNHILPLPGVGWWLVSVALVAVFAGLGVLAIRAAFQSARTLEFHAADGRVSLTHRYPFGRTRSHDFAFADIGPCRIERLDLSETPGNADWYLVVDLPQVHPFRFASTNMSETAQELAAQHWLAEVNRMLGRPARD